MAYPPSRASGRLSVAAVGGTLAYLLGVALLVAVGRSGLHPGRGVWAREFAGAEYLVLHAGVHLPVWDGLRTELLVYTVVVACLLVLGGFLVTRSVGTKDGASFRTGASIVVGYLPATLVGSASVAVSLDAVTTTQMVAPALLVGACYPIVLGGFGGKLATWVDSP